MVAAKQPTNNAVLRVLVIDDDEDDYLIVRQLLASAGEVDFQVSRAGTFEEGMNLVGQKIHDVYLVDQRLGAHTGIELLGAVRPQQWPQPFIVLTGAEDHELGARAMKLAASDFLPKTELSTHMLVKTILFALQRKKLEKERIDQLLEVNRSMDDFISIASHQLRTPATGVKQYLGMLREGFVGELTEAQQAIVEKAYESNERQLRIVTDLLKVAQVDSGKVTLRRTLIDFNKLTSDVIRELSVRFREREQIVSFRPSKTAPTASADHDTIRMVIENIIDNASKYTPAEQAIDISVEKKAKAIRIVVADRGVGIAVEDAGRLFRRFDRIENPLSTKVGGTGLGLYWAREVIELHGGRITYSPRDGGGSVFVIEIPIK